MCSDVQFDVNILCRADNINFININYRNLKNIIADNKIYCIRNDGTDMCEDRCLIIKRSHILIYKQFYSDFILLFHNFAEAEIYPEKLIKYFISKYDVQFDIFNNIIYYINCSTGNLNKYSSMMKDYITYLYSLNSIESPR